MEMQDLLKLLDAHVGCAGAFGEEEDRGALLQQVAACRKAGELTASIDTIQAHVSCKQRLKSQQIRGLLSDIGHLNKVRAQLSLLLSKHTFFRSTEWME